MESIATIRGSNWQEPFIPTKERVLRYVKAETEIIRVGRPSPFVTAEQIAVSLGYSVQTTRKLLRELVAENKVKVQGSIGRPYRFFIEAKQKAIGGKVPSALQ